MGTGTGTGNFSFFLVVSEPVSAKFGTGKKYRNRYRKNLVPEKSLGTGIGKIWYRKKSRYRYRKNLVPDQSPGNGIKNIWYQKKFNCNCVSTMRWYMAYLTFLSILFFHEVSCQFFTFGVQQIRMNSEVFLETRRCSANTGNFFFAKITLCLLPFWLLIILPQKASHPLRSMVMCRIRFSE